MSFSKHFDVCRACQRAPADPPDDNPLAGLCPEGARLLEADAARAALPVPRVSERDA